jgi:predicted nucleic acid-binding protein
MESTLLGLVLDSSFLITAERRSLRPDQAIQTIQEVVGEVPVVLCAITVAEIGHGIFRSNNLELRQRRQAFLNELTATLPIYPVTATTAGIVARVGGEEAAKGINIPFGDLIIGACALELGYAVGTGNLRHFKLIPGLKVIPL